VLFCVVYAAAMLLFFFFFFKAHCLIISAHGQIYFL
jgi:hypothetical protein